MAQPHEQKKHHQHICRLVIIEVGLHWGMGLNSSNPLARTYLNATVAIE